MDSATKTWFDNLILKNLVEKGFGPFGYPMGPNPYDLYYTKDIFAQFKEEMKLCHPQHYRCYSKGKGSELLETEKPPKMASVASSSRFAYLALRWVAQAIGGTDAVDFEHECRIDGIRGMAPQLDAYTIDENGNPIYIEVKCHEIFDAHKLELSTSYWKKIYGPGNDFGFPSNNNIPESKKFPIPFTHFGITNDQPLMDIKQLLCHLMGVASRKESNRPATLVYLFFKPIIESDYKTRLDGIFDQLLTEINQIFTSKPIQNFCTLNEIDLKVVVEESAVMERLTKKNIGFVRDYPYK